MARRRLLIACLLGLSVHLPSAVVEGRECPAIRTQVPLGVFLPNTHTVSTTPNIPDLRPPIELAQRYIAETCALEQYELQLIYKDTDCKPSKGMKSLFDFIDSRPRPVALFGGFCTTVNEPMAMALKYWKIVQLSYAETHAKFASADSQELYPTFFRIVPGDRNVNAARCRLMHHFGWQRVGTLKQSDDPRFALPHESLTNRLEHGYGIKVVYTGGVTRDEKENIGSELERLKDRDIHVIVLDVSEQLAGLVVCDAYWRHMYGESYVWILPGYHGYNWMRVPELNCSLDQMDAVLEGHFAVEFARHRRDQHTRVVGDKTAGEILAELSDSCHGQHCHRNVWQGFLYDGLWALALSMKHALGVDGSFSHERLLEALDNTSFEGVTGLVRFENNERLGLVEIRQWRNGSYRHAGVFDGAREIFRMDENAIRDWQPPLDALVVEAKRQYIYYPLYIGMSLLACVGICLAFIFLFFNIKYRDHRFIKMSSPNMNNVIIVGSICTFVSVILLGIDTRLISEPAFVRMCYAKTWTLCLGFTVAFGSMFSKTWRVHSIFTNIRMDRKAIKDSKLLMILASLLFVDLVVLGVWALVSPFSMRIMQLPRYHEENRVIIPTIEKCYSAHSMVFQAVLYAFKGILMILGCFLAWETRHVNVPALNDSKYIGMSVYNVVVMSVLGLSIAFILQERVNEAFALTCVFVIFSTTLTLCLVFVPKIFEIARNPQGAEPRTYRRGLMKSVVVNKAAATTNTNSMRDTEKDLLSQAEQENVARKKILQQKTALLWDLLEKLRDLGDTQFLQQEWCLGVGAEMVARERQRQERPSADTIGSIASHTHTNHTHSHALDAPLLREEHSMEERSSGSLFENVKQFVRDWPWTEDQHSTML